MQKDEVRVVRVVDLTNAAKERWTAFLARWPSFVLMQSYEWGAFKELSGWKTVRLGLERDGQLVAVAQMLIKPLLFGLTSVAYVPRGPLLDWEDEAAAQALFSAMHAVARQHRTFSMKIEPPAPYSASIQQKLESWGFHRSQFNNQPRCTMVIDLTADHDTILSNMSKTTRYNIRHSARTGVVVREATTADLDCLYRALECTSKRSGFAIRSREYYEREWNSLAPGGYAQLFIALYEDEVLAVRMSAAFGKQAATLHSGSFDAGRNLKPNELLMWASLKWAKVQGCTAYDVWGIPDEVGRQLYLKQPLPEHQKGGLWGVYHFKRGFGGDVVYHVGAHDFVYSQPLYRLMNTLTARLGSLERLARLGDRLDVGLPSLTD